MRPRSYLDGGTEVLPGERKFMDYAQRADLQLARADQLVGPERHPSLPLPMPFELPGYNPYLILIGEPHGVTRKRLRRQPLHLAQ